MWANAASSRHARPGPRRCGRRARAFLVSTSALTGMRGDARGDVHRLGDDERRAGTTAQREAARDRVVGGDPFAGVERERRRAGCPSPAASAGCRPLRERRRAERTARAVARSSAMSTRSQCSSTVMPMPTPRPFTAAMSGFSNAATVSMKRGKPVPGRRRSCGRSRVDLRHLAEVLARGERAARCR